MPKNQLKMDLNSPRNVKLSNHHQETAETNSQWHAVENTQQGKHLTYLYFTDFFVSDFHSSKLKSDNVVLTRFSLHPKTVVQMEHSLLAHANFKLYANLIFDR